MASWLARAMPPMTIFGLWLAWFTGWLVVPDELSPLALTWCAVTGALGLGFLIAAPWVRDLADLGSTLCQGLGLLGTVVGFMIMLSAHGVEGLEEAGIYTALSTTVVGLGFSLVLFVQHWLLSR